jgi:hypothetical protein
LAKFLNGMLDDDRRRAPCGALSGVRHATPSPRPGDAGQQDLTFREKTMKRHPAWAIGLVLLATVGMAQPAAAEDFSATYSMNDSESDGSIARGAMTVVLSNLTALDLKNVDLRLALGGGNAILGAPPVLQYGAMAFDETKALIAEVQIDQALLDEGHLSLRIDFDDAVTGQHDSIQVIATPEN